MRTLLASFLTVVALAVPSIASADDAGAISPSDSPLAFRMQQPVPSTVMEGETQWNSPAMAITGGALTLVGAANMIVGGVVYATDDCRDDNATWGCFMDMDEGIGVASMIHGGVLMAVGIPLFVAGAYQIPKKGSEEPPRTAEVRVGPSRADLVMTW